MQWMLESACTSSLLNLSQKFCKSYSQLSSLKAFKALWKWKFAAKKTAFQDVNWFKNYFMTFHDCILSILRPFTALLSACWALSIPAIPNLLLGFTSNLYLWQIEYYSRKIGNCQNEKPSNENEWKRHIYRLCRHKKQFEDAQEAARAQGSEVGRHSDMKYSGSNGEWTKPHESQITKGTEIVQKSY